MSDLSKPMNTISLEEVQEMEALANQMLSIAFYWRGKVMEEQARLAAIAMKTPIAQTVWPCPAN